MANGPFTIRIFVPDGDPEGVCWLCHGNANKYVLRAKLSKHHAAATAPCHCAVASARKIRSVDREMRWRCGSSRLQALLLALSSSHGLMLGLPHDAFTKLDAEEDEIFYEPPRLVCHIDDGAIATLNRQTLPPHEPVT